MTSSRVPLYVDRSSELELVSRLRGGDTAAFDAIYGMFNVRLFRFLARLSRNRDVAEDLLGETWMRLVAHAARLRPDTQLGPWLFTVARNLHVSYCRSRALEELHAVDLNGLWAVKSAAPSPFEQAAASECERRIEEALASLPVMYREVLLLVAVEGLRSVEAAAVCGVTPEALRQRLSRARALLARRLGEAGGPSTEILSEVVS